MCMGPLYEYKWLTARGAGRHTPCQPNVVDKFDYYSKSSCHTTFVVHMDASPSYFKINTFSESGTRVIAEYS